MLKTKDIRESIDRIIKHVKKEYDYDISISKKNTCNECDPTKKLITIVDNMSEQNMMFSLLHEVGHILIFALEDYSGSFGAIADEHHRPNNRKTNLAHFQKLKEEMFAWEMGIKLANELKLDIDFDAYDKYSAKCYMTYVRYAAQGYYQKEMKKLLKQEGIDIKFK